MFKLKGQIQLIIIVSHMPLNNWKALLNSKTIFQMNSTQKTSQANCQIILGKSCTFGSLIHVICDDLSHFGAHLSSFYGSKWGISGQGLIYTCYGIQLKQALALGSKINQNTSSNNHKFTKSSPTRNLRSKQGKPYKSQNHLILDQYLYL